MNKNEPSTLQKHHSKYIPLVFQLSCWELPFRHQQFHQHPTNMKDHMIYGTVKLK